MSLSVDKLRLRGLVTRANVLRLPGLGGTQLVQPVTLTPELAATVYSRIARHGFTGFQALPGAGAQFLTADGITTVVIAGGLWQFTEDISRSSFDIANDRQEAVLLDFLEATA